MELPVGTPDRKWTVVYRKWLVSQETRAGNRNGRLRLTYKNNTGRNPHAQKHSQQGKSHFLGSAVNKEHNEEKGRKNLKNCISRRVLSAT